MRHGVSSAMRARRVARFERRRGRRCFSTCVAELSSWPTIGRGEGVQRMTLTEKQQDLITALAEMPDTALALRTTHQRQPDGHCGVCRSGGSQAGRDVHPCTLYTIATLALAER